jgi:hypothetical protein
MTQLILLAGVYLGVFGYVLFAAWTRRRLWRRGTDPWTHVVYDQGVRGFGFRVGTVMGVVSMLLTLRKGHGDVTRWQVVFVAVLELAVMLPACLWMGYAFGRKMARAAGLTPPR